MSAPRHASRAGTANDASLAPGEPAGPPKVRAAGGVVWHRLPGGIEVVLVHRPAYDDWALPKGKAKLAESDEDTAIREVWEETGLSCRLGHELPSTTYVDGEGRLKIVRYWAMTVLPGGGGLSRLAPSVAGQAEIDDLGWAPLDQARRRLSYPRDVIVLDAFEALVSSSEVGRQ